MATLDLKFFLESFVLFLALSLVLSGPGRGWTSPLKIMPRSKGLKPAGLLVEYGTLAFENLLRMCQVLAPGRLTLNPIVNERVSDTRNLSDQCLLICVSNFGTSNK